MSAISFLTDYAFAADVRIYRSTRLNISKINKILVFVANANLNTGTELMPQIELAKQLNDWAANGVRSATKNKVIVHTYDTFVRDELLMYGSNAKDDDALYYQHVIDMGYDAIIQVNVAQKFDNEYIPGKTYQYHYTEYRTATINDRHGYAGSISIPEDRTIEIPIPEQNLTYLHTLCIPVLYMVEDGPTGEYKARVDYDIYKQYRGGPVLKVIENAMKASIKSLFTGKKK